MSLATNSTPDSGSPPSDPLAALRAADLRPLHERGLDAVRANVTRLRARTGPLLVTVAVVLGALLWWQLRVVADDPPIEDSLPVAVPGSLPSGTRPAASAADSGTSSPLAIGPPAEEVVVHVAGAVRRPGLVHGGPSWRVNDAIEAAGGADPDADLDRINLAAVLADGQRIYVPVIGEVPPPLVPGVGDPTATAGPIDINTADSTQLQTLPGVGPATAAAILTHREEHGSFGSVEALVAVRGIGPATLEALRDLIVAG